MAEKEGGPGIRALQSGGAEGTRTPDPHTARAFPAVSAHHNSAEPRVPAAPECDSLLAVAPSAWTRRGHWRAAAVPGGDAA